MEQFFLNFLQMFPTNICFEKYNKKDKSSCLFKRYKGPNLSHLCLYWYKSRARARVMEQFFLNFLRMFPTNICFEKYNKKDKSSCLFKRYKGPNLSHLCLYWYKSRTSFHRFTVHFAVAGSKVFKITLEKNLIGRKYGTILCIICGKITEMRSPICPIT